MKYYPLKLKPCLKNIIWGGTLLSQNYGMGEPGEKIAEGWNLSLRPDGENVIENGTYSGKMLGEYCNKVGIKALCGEGFTTFPLLIKLIDACDKLSVQVHPDDFYAKENGLDAGKTEMWYIVEAKEGAKLVYGLKQGISFTDEELKKAASDGSLDKFLNYVEVKSGEVYYIPAGLVHAIGSGILIAEVQQNSNTTFRLFDYDRTDKDGKKRQLHVDEAFKVIKKNIISDNTERLIKKTKSIIRKEICNCDFFGAELLELSNGGEESFFGGEMLHILCLDGEGKIIFADENYYFTKGESYLIPAVLSDYVISSNKNCKLLLSKAKA